MKHGRGSIVLRGSFAGKDASALREIDGITRKVTLELPQSRQEEWAKRSAVVS